MEQDWDLGEGLDPEGPSGSDLDRFGDEMTVCKSCGGSMYDQAEICPHCGQWVTEQDRKLPVWAILGVIVLIVLVLLMLK